MTTFAHIARYRIAIALAILLVVTALLLPVKFSRTMTVYGRVQPGREWVLIRGDGGLLQSILRNNAHGTVDAFSSTQPERGDATMFILSDSLIQGGEVHCGDTLGWTSSPDLQQQLAALEGARDVAAAALLAARTGEKPSVVVEAERQLEYAQAQYNEQQPLLLRQEKLHARGVISDEEYEQSRNRLEVLRSGITIAEAHLASVRSGLKSEELRRLEAELAATETEIAVLRGRMARYTEIAPLDGVVHSAYATDTLLIVRDEHDLMLMFPLQVDACAVLKSGCGISFDVPMTGMTGHAAVIRVERSVQYLRGMPVCLVAARVSGEHTGLRTGLIVRCLVPGPRYSVLEHLSHLLTGRGS